MKHSPQKLYELSLCDRRTIEGKYLLPYEIVLQGIRDYVGIMEGKIKEIQNGICIAEIENFFESEWCDFLLDGTYLTGAEILQYLKEKYPIKKPYIKRKKKRKRGIKNDK